MNLDEVWNRLRDRLESHSLPSALIKLDRLPLTANGKVDRRALPHPHKQRLLAAPATPPKTQSELRLVAIWKDILGLDQIGIDDSFLELGGDSLQLMRMLNRVRQIFEQDVSIPEFFASPTVSALAKILGSSDKIVNSSF